MAGIELLDDLLLDLLNARIVGLERAQLPERARVPLSENRAVDLLREDLVDQLQYLDRLVRDSELEALVELVGHQHQVQDDLLEAEQVLDHEEVASCDR